MCFKKKAYIFMIVMLLTILIFGGFLRLFNIKLFGNMTTKINYYISDSYSTERPSLFCEDNNFFLYVDDENGYKYKNFPVEYNISSDWECVDGFQMNENFVVLSFKNYDMNQYHLYKHLEDQLIYLDDKNLEAIVLYQSNKYCRILYGNEDYCLIYNANKNTFQYIDLNSEAIISELPANIKTKRCDYLFEYDIKGENIILYQYKWGTLKKLKTISILPQASK